MSRRILILAVLLFAPACATSQLRYTATRQMGTEPDLFVDQVLENLARIADDPTSLPYFSLLNSGVPAVTDKGALSGLIMFPARTMSTMLHHSTGGQFGPLNLERDVGANWTLTPINDPDRLDAMRSLYLWILGKPQPDVDAAQARLQQYIGSDFVLTNVPQGWFRCGGRHDVPKDACLQFQHHKTHYWIVPGMEEQLTRLTVTMLDIATVVPAPRRLTQTIVWKIDPRTKTTTELTITRVVPYDPTVAPASGVPLDAIVSPTSVEAVVPGFREFVSPLKERYNNYSPMVSPGLFSQPGR